MSKLEEQLKELQTKKLKADFFKNVKENLFAMVPKKEDGIEVDVVNEIAAFIDAQVDMIESGEIKTTKEINSLFTTDEVEALKRIAGKVLNKPEVPNAFPNNNNNKALTKQERLLQMTANDPIKFALKHRHLENKNVTVNNDGTIFNGKVVGLQAPNVVVETNSGQRIAVHIDKISEN